MTTLNNSGRGLSQCSATTRGPVEETGRNSVMPSMIPKMMTAIQSGMNRLDGKTRRKTRKTAQAGKRQDLEWMAWGTIQPLNGATKRSPVPLAENRGERGLGV